MHITIAHMDDDYEVYRKHIAYANPEKLLYCDHIQKYIITQCMTADFFSPKIFLWPLIHDIKLHIATIFFMMK